MSMNQELEKVGCVTESEKNEMLNLFERVMGLQELIPVVEKMDNLSSDNKTYYERIVLDLGSTKKKQTDWWREMSQKYQWKNVAGARWQIDFDSNTIYLNYN